MRRFACVCRAFRISRVSVIALAAFVCIAASTLAPTIARGQQAAQPAAGGNEKEVTYDKSLAPDGKPWTGAALIKYWKSKRPDLNFKLVERLEVDAATAKRLAALAAADNNNGNGNADQPAANSPPPAPPKLTPKEAAKLRREKMLAKRNGGKTAAVAGKADDKPKKKNIVIYSETPARTELLEKISEQFMVEPDRAIVDFAGGREAAYATMGEQYPAYFSGPPSSFASDSSAQKIHWIKAVEIIDFRGNEQAAKAYYEEFGKSVRLAPMRLGSVVVTGDAFYVRDIDTIMAGGVLPPIDGKGESKKVAGYKGYPVTMP